MSGRQLHLFAGKRQRGRALPSPKEFALHCALADLLRRWCNPAWRFTHIPLGERRDPITAGRLKRMGAMPGWPDFIFVGPATVFFLELKRKKSKPSAVQAEVGRHIMRCGFKYLATDSYADAVDTLRDLGVVRARVSA